MEFRAVLFCSATGAPVAANQRLEVLNTEEAQHRLDYGDNLQYQVQKYFNVESHLGCLVRVSPFIFRNSA